MLCTYASVAVTAAHACPSLPTCWSQKSALLKLCKASLPPGCRILGSLARVSGLMSMLKVEGADTVTIFSEFVDVSAVLRNAAGSTVCAPAGATPRRKRRPARITVAQKTTQTGIVGPVPLL